MKNIIKSTLAMLAISAASAFAADSANQQLNFEVKAFCDIQLADKALNLVISSIPLGGQGEATAASSYSLVNNKLDQKITASLDSDMPSDTTLTLDAGAPKNAAAVGAVTLSAKAVDVATKVNRVNESGIALNYTFNATEQASTEPFVRTVTYTVIAM
jgi:hypothetical protein